MKQFIQRTTGLLAGLLLVVSCQSNKLEVPGQPDFIVVGLEYPYTIQMGESFELSVPEESGAESYFWQLPEMLNVLEGENTSRLLVSGLIEGVIPAGVITVTAINAAGNSTPRTLWKEITITGLPPRPAYVQTSIEGSLTVDMDEEFTVYVPDDETIASYTWSVPEELTIVDGRETSRVIVKANRKSVNIPANAISVTTVSKTGLQETHHFEKMIVVLPIDEYHTAKRYGTKTWMTVNLNYAGEDGTVGRTAPDDPDGTKYGRYYTWEEAMTGLSAGENPYIYGSTGTDDMGNSYTFNDGVTSYNVQIRGICPEGWHIPNAYDFYDLAVGVADDYGLRKNSIEEVVSAVAGIYLPDNRETKPMAAMNMIDYGFIASYLRGSRPAAEGGMWAAHGSAVDNGTMFNLTKASGKFPAGKYPMYFPDEIERIGFNILPCGQYKGDTFGSFGAYSFHWTATVTSSNKHYRITIGNNSCNFSTYAESGSSNNVRCVANY